MHHLLQKYVLTPPPAVRRVGGLVFKVLILGLTLAALYDAVLAAPAVATAWRGLVHRVLTVGTARWFLLAAALLVPVNWGLEAVKWRFLARRVEPISFGRAFRAVVLGLTMGFSTPNRVGDYAARVLLLRSRRRLVAVGAVFLGRYAQLVVTSLFGSLGAGYFLLKFHLSGYLLVQLGAAVALVLANAALVGGLYAGGWLARMVATVPALRRWARYGRVLADYPPAELTRVLLWSALRYGVFVGQFGLLVAAFGLNVSPWEGALAISGTFLLKSLVPSLSALTDIGARELSAVHFFGLLHQPALPVLSASLCLWLLNIALPSAAGLVLVPRVRLWLTGQRTAHRPHGRRTLAADRRNRGGEAAR